MIEFIKKLSVVIVVFLRPLIGWADVYDFVSEASRGKTQALGTLLLRQPFPELSLRPAVRHSDSPELQSLIDQLTVSMFSATDTGTSLCQVSQANWVNLIYSFGLSVDAALKIQNICLNKTNLNSVAISKYSHKSYVFILLKPEDTYELSSMTNFENTTFLFIRKGTTLGQLLLMLLHEAAVASDALRIHSEAELIRLQFHEDPTYSDRELFVKMAPDSLNNQLLRLLVLPEISTTFALMRAIEFERRWMSERTGRFIERVPCQKEFFKILNTVTKNPRYYHPAESGIRGDLQATMLMNLEHAVEMNPTRAAFELLAPKSVITLLDGKEIQACDFLRTPWLTKKSSLSFYAYGPRPGAGDGFLTKDVDTLKQWNLSWCPSSSTNSKLCH